MSHADVAALRQQYTRASARERWGEAAAVAVLLKFEPIAADDRFAVHVTRSGVDWDDLLADQTWSLTERFLIATAAGLWTGRCTQADISRVAFLDDTFFAAWAAMITAARTGCIPRAGGGEGLSHG